MANDLNSLLVRDAVALKLGSDSAEDVIRSLAGKLQRGGYVRPTYEDAAVEREKSHPTGTPAGVALPQADPVHVIKPGIALATLARTVSFASSDDPGKPVQVGVVFLLAASDKAGLAAMQRNIEAFVRDPAAFRRLSDADNIDDVLAAFDGRDKTPAEDDDD